MRRIIIIIVHLAPPYMKISGYFYCVKNANCIVILEHEKGFVFLQAVQAVLTIHAVVYKVSSSSLGKAPIKNCVGILLIHWIAEF